MGFWLFQAPDQPEHVGSALALYVLSSDVRIDELTGERALVALPGSSEDGGDSDRRRSGRVVTC